MTSQYPPHFFYVKFNVSVKIHQIVKHSEGSDLYVRFIEFQIDVLLMKLAIIRLYINFLI